MFISGGLFWLGYQCSYALIDVPKWPKHPKISLQKILTLSVSSIVMKKVFAEDKIRLPILFSTILITGHTVYKNATAYLTSSLYSKITHIISAVFFFTGFPFYSGFFLSLAGSLSTD
ncbi:MAG: hypothetical protein FJZ58_01290 [Chlamydiae bacterium]|nr:hypothetical protein [Chlamydiota bacterium]